MHASLPSIASKGILMSKGKEHDAQLLGAWESGKRKREAGTGEDRRDDGLMMAVEQRKESSQGR